MKDIEKALVISLVMIAMGSTIFYHSLYDSSKVGLVVFYEWMLFLHPGRFLELLVPWMNFFLETLRRHFLETLRTFLELIGTLMDLFLQILQKCQELFLIWIKLFLQILNKFLETIL